MRQHGAGSASGGTTGEADDAGLTTGLDSDLSGGAETDVDLSTDIDPADTDIDATMDGLQDDLRATTGEIDSGLSGSVSSGDVEESCENSMPLRSALKTLPEKTSFSVRAVLMLPGRDNPLAIVASKRSSGASSASGRCARQS